MASIFSAADFLSLAALQQNKDTQHDQDYRQNILGVLV
jgi:hypothetical protein